MSASRISHARLSLLSRVFLANVTVMVIALLLLAFTPITVTAPVIQVAEAVLVAMGAALVLGINLLLVRHTLAPLRRLTRTMSTIDTQAAGRRIEPGASDSEEVAALTDAFNGMLDRLEHERRESAREALRAQENERLRIARELHDEIGQTLTSVALHAERMSHGPRETLPDALLEVAATVRDSLDDVRRIAHELRPEALDDLGLVNALITLCERVSAQSGMEIRRRFIPPPPGLDRETELVVYRIAQEALTNALRHSEAGTVLMSFTGGDGAALLVVEDDGRGLDADEPGPGAGLGHGGGIAGMRERALFVGGDLTIGAGSGDRGTSVRLRLP
jgi:two-component system sensor histidine kinase UhpB